MSGQRYSLQAFASVVLDANGNGTAALNVQQNTGPPTWEITGLILQTSRPNVAPIPTCQIYLDQISPAQSQGLTANGSYATARGENLTLIRGQILYAVWSGGSPGDVATITATGVKS